MAADFNGDGEVTLAMRWTFYARQHLWILTMQILVLSGPMSEM